jgi:hypothetical protein
MGLSRWTPGWRFTCIATHKLEKALMRTPFTPSGFKAFNFSLSIPISKVYHTAFE